MSEKAETHVFDPHQQIVEWVTKGNTLDGPEFRKMAKRMEPGTLGYIVDTAMEDPAVQQVLDEDPAASERRTGLVNFLDRVTEPTQPVLDSGGMEADYGTVSGRGGAAIVSGDYEGNRGGGTPGNAVGNRGGWPTSQ